ncbi:MAG: class 1b ribonucleoside-diphosphate reductase subunit beta [Firmicutes bacterium]|nr:class 1b ribonucleoside-diphosphate reductase subunit beta [Bacillota bacterium]MCL1954249.1 class 1b ribonucleoside-diphosphate reductase subunit beta [Bacillota bacterium]
MVTNDNTLLTKAVNWNTPEDNYSLTFWKQNTMQFWLEDEVPVSQDKNTWNTLTPIEKDTYKKVLGGLTLLDTKQGGDGMHLIPLHMDRLQAKGVFTFMGGMEEIHAKSYSHMFSTLATDEEIDELFKWIETDPILDKKEKLITSRYHKLFTPNAPKKDVYMALVTGVFLESFLFYSGFFYPLWWAGQGKLTACGEIINLILRDESLHGTYTGLIAQDIFKTLSPQDQEEVEKDRMKLLKELYENELEYSNMLYSPVGLVEDVQRFVRYNANSALKNLGIQPYFPIDEVINPIVLNGLKTDTKHHDFFSVKGNGYVKSINVEKLTDEDFE